MAPPTVVKDTVGAGDAFMAPLNVPHAYVTLGTEPAHMLHLFNPAGDMEGFRRLCPSCQRRREPDHQKLAEVSAKHGVKVVGSPLMASSVAS